MYILNFEGEGDQILVSKYHFFFCSWGWLQPTQTLLTSLPRFLSFRGRATISLIDDTVSLNVYGASQVVAALCPPHSNFCVWRHARDRPILGAPFEYTSSILLFSLQILIIGSATETCDNKFVERKCFETIVGFVCNIERNLTATQDLLTFCIYLITYFVIVLYIFTRFAEIWLCSRGGWLEGKSSL